MIVPTSLWPLHEVTLRTPERQLFTWWSYRAADWDGADKGRRLDHVWVTPSLKKSVMAAEVERSARGWALPSDHVPVIVTLK